MIRQSQAAQPAPKPSPAIARQPIMGRDESVLGYELSFSPLDEDSTQVTDAKQATQIIVDSLTLVGFDVVCDGRLAFLNTTREILLNDWLSLLPAGSVALEIQSSVVADGEVFDACKELKHRGYTLALDNFLPNDPRSPLLPCIDFLKIEPKRIPAHLMASLIPRHAKTHRTIALRVESREDQVNAVRTGFTHFQGYYFRRPERLRARQTPANRVSHVRLLQAIAKPQLDMAEIENLIKHEPSLCYRLLRHLNSPLLACPAPVNSVRHALQLLGEEALVRWIRAATVLEMNQEKSSDLILSALTRARFCELLAPKLEHGQSDLFLLGMLSLMDVMLEVPMGVAIENLSLHPDIREQLLCGKSGGKTSLSPLYNLMLMRELGDWEGVTRIDKQLGLSLIYVNKVFNEAMQWARGVTAPAPPPNHAAKAPAGKKS